MNKKILAMMLILCCISVFYAQQPKFKTKKDNRCGSKKVDSKQSEQSIVRVFDLLTISAVKDGDVFIGGRNTLIKDENTIGYGFFLKISDGKITFKELPFLNDVKHIFFVDNLVGWVSGIGGTYKTENGGDTWEKLTDSDNLRSPMFFLNSYTGWIFGEDEYLRQISNEKIEKVKLFTNFPHFKKLQFTSKTNGWLISILDSKAKFQYTQDGGKNWELVVLDNSDVVDFQFTNEYEGYAITIKGIYSTNDTGRSWNLLKRNTEINGYDKVFFINKDIGWIIGHNICFTNNHGLDWDCKDFQNELDIKFIKEVVFVNAKIGWLLTDKGLYFTEDSGNLWQRKFISEIEMRESKLEVFVRPPETDQ